MLCSWKWALNQETIPREPLLVLGYAWSLSPQILNFKKLIGIQPWCWSSRLHFLYHLFSLIVDCLFTCCRLPLSSRITPTESTFTAVLKDTFQHKMYQILSISHFYSAVIHSSADGHLGCFHVLAIINTPSYSFTLFDLSSLLKCWSSIIKFYNFEFYNKIFTFAKRIPFLKHSILEWNWLFYQSF